MSFETDLFALLNANAGVTALVGAGTAARVYPVLAPTDVDAPFITWQRVGSEPTDLIGRSNTVRLSVQLDCWAKTFDEALALSEAVRVAIEGSQGAIRGALETDTDFFEDASRLYRRLASYVLYHPAN